MTRRPEDIKLSRRLTIDWMVYFERRPLCLNIYPGDGASTDEGFLEWVLSLFIAQMRLIIENEMAINLWTPGSLALVSTVALSGIVT